MADDTTRRRFLTGAGGTATLFALAGCLGGGGSEDTETSDDTTETSDGMTETGMDDTETDEGSMEPVTFTVRIENTAPTDFYGSDSSTGGAVWITPGAFAVHTESNPMFTEGEEASIGLEALAEAGPLSGFEGEPGLVDELGGMADGDTPVVSAGAYTPAATVADPNDPMGEVPGAPPIAPGGAFEFEVTSPPGTKLSFASMFVPSNDLFFAPADGIPLWSDGEPVAGDVTDPVGLWDAGTEPNANPPGQGPDQAPAQDSPTQGDDEGSVVRPLNAVTNEDYSYPAVSDAISVTVTPQ